MPEIPQDLWPDFAIVSDENSPKHVIKRAGDGLKAKTKGTVEWYLTGTQLRDNKITVNFSLWVAPLTYHYPFLIARYQINPQYPVMLSADKLPGTTEADSPDDLIAKLAAIFNAPSTIDTINQLIKIAR